MTKAQAALAPHNASRNSKSLVSRIPTSTSDTLAWWVAAYFETEVTTAASSRKVQTRDLELFVSYALEVEGTAERALWSPRLTGAFQNYLRAATIDNVGRKRGDRTINRIIAHVKTFARWVHRVRPFPLGDPTAKIKLPNIGNGLEVERALTAGERRRLLDAADVLLTTGGRSRDRLRFKKTDERPVRRGYRAWRNRAMVYALIETGMRRAAIVNLNLADVDFKSRALSVVEKGGARHAYHISRDGLNAISDYLEHERATDNRKWNSPALFLSPATNAHGDGRLAVRVVNEVWNEVCRVAGVEGKSPHAARHAMGRFIMDKTGNVAAVQRQLGHRNAAYSLQYARITADELRNALDER